MLDTTPSELIRVSPVTFPAGDAQLGGTLFLPLSAPRAALVLNGATGVPQGYYRHFARWLAATQGIACLTYDYRGVGLSAVDEVRGCDATMLDWALVDQPAARAEIRRQVPGAPLWVLGHSLGAMLLPMQQGIAEIERVFAVASGYVHYSDHPWPYQGLARLFWFGHAPLLTWMLGYLPGRRLGFGEDLPSGVYWQWRRWCISPAFFWPEVGQTIPAPNWSVSGAPVRVVAFSDDVTAPDICARRLGRAYGAEGLTHVVLSPEAFGLRSIGHIGAFSRANTAVWPALLGDVAV
ncbi:alpha/beta hydrolase [Aestuariivita sp.]|jgi:predicted alpha/beta hydrolase|uniref:alpha/beta hydrolase family protein n=1 Tax=Aestuariivita sp. TaxID=1872407 RepID=UPI00216DC767|nr:alpha/beta hydrolase [Aestuariivita sp.]MCE8006506.1 alpha/beta fold hydrolase [Aestuariivita sp.]